MGVQTHVTFKNQCLGPLAERDDRKLIKTNFPFKNVCRTGTGEIKDKFFEKNTTTVTPEEVKIA